LVGVTATLHTVVLLDVFASQPATASRYAIANVAIMFFQFGTMVVGYLVGRTSAPLIAVARRWQRRRNWRVRRDSKRGI
jgi:hypothetical protein